MLGLRCSDNVITIENTAITTNKFVFTDSYTNKSIRDELIFSLTITAHALKYQINIGVN